MTTDEAVKRQAAHECMLAEALSLIEEIDDQADESYVLGTGNHRRVTLGRIYEKCNAFMARAKEQQQ